MDYVVDKDTLVFKLKDKLIMSNSDKIKNDIKKQIDETINKHTIDYVFIDLNDVDFIDSTGVGVFISIFKFLSEKNIHLKIIRPQEIVSKILTITKIGNIINIEQ